MSGLILKPFVGEVRVTFEPGKRGMLRAFTVTVQSFTVNAQMQAVEVFFDLRPGFPNDRKLSRVFLDEASGWQYDYHQLGTHLEPVTVEVIDPGVTQQELERAASALSLQTGQLQWALPLE